VNRGLRAAVAAGLAGVLAGCSSAATPVSMPGSVVNKGTVDESAKGTTIAETIQVGDDWFSPTFIKAAPGTTVTLDLVDVGEVTHTFTIDGQHIDVIFSQKGQKRAVTIMVPPNGRPVIFYCKYHQEVGMQGALYTH
jgi:plastocyanin